MARLTAKGIEAATPAEKRREIADDLLAGLYFIVQPTGAKSWAVRYRLHGRSHKHTIGRYPLFDLKAAREWLTRYYDARDKAVANAVVTVLQLHDSQVSIEVPDVTASLEAVRNYRLTRERSR